MVDKPIRILIVDDHGVVREGLRAVLEREGLTVVGEACNGREAIDLTHRLHPDVVLLDIRMPDCNGLRALVDIKAALPDTRVIMLTTYATPDYLVRAVSAGADGYLSKDTDPQRIPAVVRAAMAEERLLEPDLLRQALMTAARFPVEPAPASTSRSHAPLSLSEREQEVLALIAEGNSNRAIADALAISIPTVKTHVRHILEKIGVSDRTQAAVWAVRHSIGGVNDDLR